MRRTLTALSSLSLLTLCLWPSGAKAAGWTQPRDGYYLKVWARGLFGDQAMDAEGEVVPVEGYRDLQLNVYGEYGVTDHWTAVFFGTPSGYASAERDTFYVGPLGLGLRRALLTGAWKLAAEAQYALESGIGDENLFAPPDAGDETYLYIPAVDNHRGELQLQLGRGLPFGWMSFAAGGRLNSAKGIDHAVSASAQLGWQVSQRWQLQFNLQTYQPLGDVEVTNVSGVGQSRYYGFGLGVGYRFGDRIGVVAAFDGGGAQSNAATPSLQAGVELQ